MEIMRLLEEFENVVEESSRIPMTGRVIIHEDILYKYLDGFRAMLPETIREAEWVIREKDRIIKQAEKEADTIVETAKSKLEKIAGESEIVKEAKAQGEEIINNARNVAREITQGSFAYADEIMAKLQEQLERTMSVVNQGRDELRLNIKDKNISE
ncbi:MAG: ATP synthase F0 subunit B [Clostridia bacterium]|nr:ATP synthase F0 subunit B [Clostridia bacterium]